MKSQSTAILLSGTASRTINPPQGLWLIGYPNPHKRANTGVALDLVARAIVLGQLGSESPAAAIIVLDTIFVSQDVVKRIRNGAAEKIPGLPADAIMVAATHTHSAPILCPGQLGDQQTPQTTQYIQYCVDRSVEALEAAWQDHAEVRMRVGRAEARLGHNRRVVDDQGHATNDWFDVEGRHIGFFNPNVRFLVFEDVQNSQPRAVLSLYGCHPVTLGPGNIQVSADYPGYFCNSIEKALPGCSAIHLTGAAGNINPRNALFVEHDNAKSFGQQLAQSVLDAMPTAVSRPSLPLAVQSQTLTLALSKEASQHYSGRAADSPDGRTLTSEIQVIRLGDVALISTPGELFAEIGVSIENSSPFTTTLVAGFANDNLGYLCTDTAMREGGYEAKGAISDRVEQAITSTARVALEQALRR